MLIPAMYIKCLRTSYKSVFFFGGGGESEWICTSLVDKTDMQAVYHCWFNRSDRIRHVVQRCSRGVQLTLRGTIRLVAPGNFNCEPRIFFVDLGVEVHRLNQCHEKVQDLAISPTCQSRRNTAESTTAKLTEVDNVCYT